MGYASDRIGRRACRQPGACCLAKGRIGKVNTTDPRQPGCIGHLHPVSPGTGSVPAQAFGKADKAGRVGAIAVDNIVPRSHGDSTQKGVASRLAPVAR
jgi:hypothetical protein